ASHLERIARDGYTILERVIEPELVYLQRLKRSSTSGQRATPSRVRIPCASTTCSCMGSSTSRFPSTRGCSRSSRASSIRDAWCRLCRRSASARASARAPTLRTSKIYGMTNSFRKGGGLVDAPGRRVGPKGKYPHRVPIGPWPVGSPAAHENGPDSDFPAACVVIYVGSAP